MPTAHLIQQVCSAIFPQDVRKNQQDLKEISLFFKYLLRSISCIVLLSTILTPSLSAAGHQPENQRRMLALSDIHFNPFYDETIIQQLVDQPCEQWDKIFSTSQQTAVSVYGQETNPPLFSMVMTAAKKQALGISAIVFTGDLLAHDFNQQFVNETGLTSDYERNKFIAKTMEYITLKLRLAFPGTPVYFSLGNNDDYSGDYILEDDGEFLHTTADFFYSNLIKDKNAKKDFYNTYPVHGYYNIKLKNASSLRIIGLNTIYYSANYYASGGTDPGNDELIWLEAQLKQAQSNNEKLWMVLHIPPGVNVYSTQHGSTPSRINVVLQWKNTYNNRFLELVKTYHEQIACMFAGHTHMDDFRLIYNDSAHQEIASMIHITPSVTPVFKNNPAFQVIGFDGTTGALLDSTTYCVDLKSGSPMVSKEYSFYEAYGTWTNTDGLNQLYPQISSDQKTRDQYTAYYYSSSTAASIASVWQWYWCGAGNLTPDEYTQAMKSVTTTSK